jgi:hypothetical protein
MQFLNIYASYLDKTDMTDPVPALTIHPRPSVLHRG